MAGDDCKVVGDIVWANEKGTFDWASKVEGVGDERNG